MRPTSSAVATTFVAVLVAAVTATLAAPASTLAAGPPSAPRQDTLTLMGALRRALEVDPTLRAAAAGVDRAGSELDAARASRLPWLTTHASAVRFEEPMVVAPIHGFDIMTPPDFDRTLVQGGLSLAYTVWDGGARGARIDRAVAMDDVAHADTTATLQMTIERAVAAYLAVLTARDVLEAQRLRMDALEAERSRVARFLEEGAAARLELLRARAELSAGRADEAAAEARLELAEADLARLLDVPREDVRRASLRDVAPGGDRVPPAAAPAGDQHPAGGSTDPEMDREVDTHPAVRAALARVQAAAAGTREARAAWFPRVVASGRLSEWGGGSTDFSTEWQGGVAVELPLFTGGARRAGAEASRAHLNAADANLDATRRQVHMAADRALAAEREAAARALALEEAVTQFEELARVEALALREGVGVQRDWLQAQAGLVRARAGLAEASRGVILARVRLARALGTLTLDRIDQDLEDVS
jgi:outer membrane protein TolC